MNSSAVRLRLVIVMLAWLAQALMPVVHAAVMSGAKTSGQVWCGQPASEIAALALLPAELRAALDPHGPAAEHLASCAALCAAGTAAMPVADLVPAGALRAPGREPAGLPALSDPAARPQSPTPPAHAPPLHG